MDAAGTDRTGAVALAEAAAKLPKVEAELSLKPKELPVVATAPLLPAPVMAPVAAVVVVAVVEVALVAAAEANEYGLAKGLRAVLEISELKAAVCVEGLLVATPGNAADGGSTTEGAAVEGAALTVTVVVAVDASSIIFDVSAAAPVDASDSTPLAAAVDLAFLEAGCESSASAQVGATSVVDEDEEVAAVSLVSRAACFFRSISRMSRIRFSSRSLSAC